MGVAEKVPSCRWPFKHHLLDQTQGRFEFPRQWFALPAFASKNAAKVVGCKPPTAQDIPFCRIFNVTHEVVGLCKRRLSQRVSQDTAATAAIRQPPAHPILGFGNGSTTWLPIASNNPAYPKECVLKNKALKMQKGGGQTYEPKKAAGSKHLILTHNYPNGYVSKKAELPF